MTTLRDVLSDVATRHPERPAIVEGSQRLDYKGLQQLVASSAQQLRNRGVRPRDSVALFMPNSAHFVISFFAAAEAGATVVPLNPQYQENELARVILDSRASVIVTTRQLESLARRVCRELPIACEVLLREESDLQAPQREPDGTSAHLTVIDPRDPVIFQYTSGSTDLPKRIARSQANLTFELDSLTATLGLSHQDRLLGVTPFSHVNGLVRSMLASVRVGATLFPLPEFKRQQVANTIQREGITVFIGVPFMFGILAATRFRPPMDFSSLRVCCSSSASMPVDINRQFHRRYGMYVRQIYGSTETGTVSVNLADDIEESLSSVGLPIQGVEFAVLRDDMAVANPGERGEVAVKSPGAISSYDGEPEGSEAFRDGYFLTGDVGTIDERGRLYLVGRKKFFINKGGYKVNPWEIERLIESHPSVREVVVVGVDAPFGDERIKAVIVPSKDCTEHEIVEFCRGKIADFKVPSLVQFREALPKTATGKVLRTML